MRKGKQFREGEGKWWVGVGGGALVVLCAK